MTGSQGDYEIKEFSSILGGVFENLDSQNARKASDAFSVWRKVLLGIKSSTNPNEGANLAAHSRIVDLKNGVLLIEADHPGWIELLQLRKQFILKGLSFYAKDMQVETLAFRLAGKRGNVGGADYSAQEARGLAESRLKREEAALAKWSFTEKSKVGPTEKAVFTGIESPHGEDKGVKASSRTELPPDLAAALSALKQDMGA